MKTVRNNPAANKIPITLLILFCLLFQATDQAFGQGLRRPAKTQRQIQKKLDKRGANQIAPSGDTAPTTTNPAGTAVKQDQAQPQKHSLDGISQRGPRAMFKPDEVAMMIQGFGNAPAMMVLMRQLDLTEEQKVKFRMLKRQIGPKLADLQADKRAAEAQLEDTIYGENFDPQRVETLAAQSAEKTAEIIKTQAFIESQFRQILSPDQFYVFRFLVGEMVLPQRRVPLQQLLRQQQQQRRLGNQPNAPTRPPDRELPDGGN